MPPLSDAEREDEAVTLAMADVSADMASRGKRVWEPAQTETSKRIAALYDALREEWFSHKLPDLDYEVQTNEGTFWAWRLHPWFGLLELSDEDCYEALRG